MKKIIVNELIDYFCKKNPLTEGEELYIVSKTIFKDYEEHDINFHYGDGFAISEDKQYFMTYPKVKELTTMQKGYMEEYQGFGMPRKYTPRDCALCFGELRKI